MNKKKTVSVVMCTYNGEKYIREQLDSILYQTYPVDEIIIQDDCSTDNTCKILYEYQKLNPQIVVIRNAQNKGINHNFFSAISRAKNDYIAISDQDDIWELDKIELQLKFIGNKLFCAGKSTPFSTDDTVIRVDERDVNISLFRQIFVGTISGHTILFHRDLFYKINLRNENLYKLSSVEMYDSILSIIALSCDSVVYINKTIVKQRRYLAAATYNVPIDNKMSISNIIKSVRRTWISNKKLKSEIKRRLSLKLAFLEEIDSQQRIKYEVIRMLQFYISSSPLDFIRLVCFCIVHRESLFYSKDVKNGLISVLRAAYFPISLSDYYRYLL